jgi:hypothetical protein
MIEALIVGLVLAAGAVAGWLSRRPRWLVVLILLGAVVSGVYLVVLLREPSFLENDEEGDVWRVFATVTCLVLWAAWSVGVGAGASLRRLNTARKAR